MMGIPSSTFYYKPTQDRLEREKQDADLRGKIETIHVDFPRSGYRTMQVYLERALVVVGERRLRRVMRENGLCAEIKKAFVVTTDSEHDHLVHPNLLPQMGVTGIDQVWASDMTYIRIKNGFVYLAVILDLYSRKVVGWAISKRIDAALTVEALNSAIEKRKPKPGIIHHSDRGVQYLCEEYVEILKENGFFISCSRRGNPYDNAWVESFMKTLKKEEVYLWHYETYWDVIERLPIFLEEVYNKKRVHSSLGYKTPEEFELETKNNNSGQPILIL
jgi:transposase InsO family protein